MGKVIEELLGIETEIPIEEERKTETSQKEEKLGKDVVKIDTKDANMKDIFN